jgi:tRNA (guanine-N7-)-methyltransferase
MVRDNTDVFVIGNGDIKSYNDLLEMQKTGCDAFMIGRATLGNPWIFEELMGKNVEISRKDIVLMILEHARRNPDINYIGLEVAESVLVRALEKLIDEPLPNLILLHIDAFKLNDIFEDGEIDKLFLNFSDPWPKSRHAKRRLTCNNILNSYRKAIKVNGSIEFKTDNRKLFEYSLLEFIHNGLKFNDLSLNLHEDKEDIITTEYEDKFTSKGNVIYFVEVLNNEQ